MMMAGAISSSSAATSSPKRYDVFISFRGEDTRCNFTSHLHSALSSKQIEAYMDDRLHKGDQIWPALQKAIEESYVSIVIFSENYAFSKWCLDELTEILKCEKMGQIVIPVFYKINPSNVRKQTGSYGKAFAKHEQDFGNNNEKVQKWKAALNEASTFSGWHSEKYPTEQVLIQGIVKDIVQKVNHMHPHDLKKLVGIDHKYACIKSLLEIGSEGVRSIGIWGMGGIGKTTIAALAFVKLSSQFEGSCFLSNVREESEKLGGLNDLRKKLLSKLLEEDDLHVDSPLIQMSSVMRRPSRKRVFIVLDDVNTTEQLEHLIGDADCLGAGSRVIITSRNKHVLISGRVHGRVHEIHEVRELTFQESLQLFSMNAFNKTHPEIGYEELSERVVRYAQGNPLASKILGSNFSSIRNTEIWERKLEKLGKYPDEKIQNVLKLSYDELQHTEREIFLDIACFFSGEDEKYVKELLDACEFFAAEGIDTLRKKALVNGDEIRMHDLIKEMGRGIVREESFKNPGSRSRLWDVEEICDVLENDMGTDAVEAIKLDMSRMGSDLHLGPDTFKRMIKLRFLKLYDDLRNKVCLQSGLNFLPNKLRLFEWHGYNWKSLPSTFCPKHLVKISMPHSDVEKLWSGVQDLVNLKRVNLSSCKHLIGLPDFSKAEKLERITLYDCTSLCEVHPSILSLHNLVTLELQECKSLKSLKSKVLLRSLQNLHLNGCSSLKEFSVTSEKMTYLNLKKTSIVELPSSIGVLNRLKELRLGGCKSLKDLPNELFGLISLEVLDLSDCGLLETSNLAILFRGLCYVMELDLRNCSKLYQVPDNISLLSHLSSLHLSGTSIETLPASIIHLSGLRHLCLTDCRRLRFVPELPRSIARVNARNCTSLEKIFITSSAVKKSNLFILLNNCVKLDPHIVNTMLNRLKEGEIRGILYPGSKIPNWITYQTTEPEATITIEPPPCNSFRLFACVILSQFSSADKFGICDISCSPMVDIEDDEDLLGSLESVFLVDVHVDFDDYYRFGIDELTSDHVCIWWDDLKLRSEEDIPKLSYKFSAQNFMVKNIIMDVIKGCGLLPIYDTDFSNHKKKKKRKINDVTDSEGEGMEVGVRKMMSLELDLNYPQPMEEDDLTAGDLQATALCL